MSNLNPPSLPPSQRFEVGEVAIVDNPGTINHGREVTVLSKLKYEEKVMNTYTGECTPKWVHDIEGDLLTGPFGAQGKNHYRGVGEPKFLRKKPPKVYFAAGTWSNCHFKPKEVKA